MTRIRRIPPPENIPYSGNQQRAWGERTGHKPAEHRMTALRALIARLHNANAEGSPVDLLHVEHLPTVGLLLGTMAGVYYLFRRKYLRWGPDVDALLAERDRLLAEKDARIAELAARVIAEHEDSERWSNTAWDIARAAGRMSETTKEATHAVRVLAENGAPGGTAGQQVTGR